jgi:hypothetical protein
MPPCGKKWTMRRVVIGKVPFIGISDPCRCRCRFGRSSGDGKFVEQRMGRERRAVWQTLQVIGILNQELQLSERHRVWQEAEMRKMQGRANYDANHDGMPARFLAHQERETDR